MERSYTYDLLHVIQPGLELYTPTHTDTQDRPLYPSLSSDTYHTLTL